MLNGFIKLYFIFVLSLFCLSCTKAQVENSDNAAFDHNESIIHNVPFIKQKYRFCGPAALTSVMRHYGQNVEQDEVAKNVYTPELKGSLISDMKHYAAENGFNAQTKNGNLDKVNSLITQKIPVILLVDRGKWVVDVQHYYVVYGYNVKRNTFIIHDGNKSGREISFDKLDKEWKKMNRLMLVIRK